MKKKEGLLIAVGILFVTSGCSKTQASANSAPTQVQATSAAARAATVVPAPVSLPAVSGHWTITFEQRGIKEDYSSIGWMPGPGRNIGVLKVDLTDGVNVVKVYPENPQGSHAVCTQ